MFRNFLREIELELKSLTFLGEDQGGHWDSVLGRGNSMCKALSGGQKQGCKWEGEVGDSCSGSR